MGEPMHYGDTLTSGVFNPFLLESFEVPRSVLVHGMFILNWSERVGHLIYQVSGNLVQHYWLNVFLYISTGRFDSQDGKVKDNSWVCFGERGLLHMI